MGAKKWARGAGRTYLRTDDEAGAGGGSADYARAKATGAQTLSNDTTTAIALDDEDFDSGTIHDNSTNNSRLTIPSDGWYIFGGSLRFASNATGRRQVSIQLNGTTTLVLSNAAAINGATTQISLSSAYYFSAGDYIELYGYQNSGGNLDTVAAAPTPILWLTGPLG